MDDQSATPIDYALWMVSQGYLEVDAQGRIWRLAELRRNGRWYPVTRRRAETDSGNGYLKIRVRLNGRVRSVGAHVVVWVHVNRRPVPPGMEINHKNRRRADNWPGNLEVVTHPQNMEHAWANGAMTGRAPMSHRGGRPVLTDADKAAIRSARARGVPTKDLVAQWGYGKSYINKIVAGKY